MQTKKDITPEQAQVRLEELCVRSERSSGELRQKLWQWHIAPSDADKIIASLTENKFVDDQRFAEAYTRDKVLFSRWGRRKIMAGLKTKRVSDQIIRHALDNIDQDLYIDNLRQVIMAKIKASPTLPESYEGRTKIFRHVISKGYEPDLTARILRELLIG